MMAWRLTIKLTDSAFGISEVRSRLCGVDNAGLAALLPTLPVGQQGPNLCTKQDFTDFVKAKSVFLN